MRCCIDKLNVNNWIRKLSKMNLTEDEQKLRNDYIWFLVVQMESGGLNLPFTNTPPEGSLDPIKEAVVVPSIIKIKLENLN